MGEQSAISWTTHTFNPWWGCWKIADECKNCYADVTANRHAPGHWGRTAPRRFFGDQHWREPRRWNARAQARGVRERVFVASMADWAERHAVPETNALLDAARAELFALIDECPWLDWLLLTKRIDDAATMLPWVRWPREPWAQELSPEERAKLATPWPNVWVGVTCGTRASLPLVHRLREVPAAVRFVSGEPLLEHISRDEWSAALSPVGSGPPGELRPDGGITRPHTGIDLLIIGDESGNNRRAAQVDWIRTAREAAIANGVRFHFKQWNGPEGGGISGRIGDKQRKIHLPLLDGKRWDEIPASPIADESADALLYGFRSEFQQRPVPRDEEQGK